MLTLRTPLPKDPRLSTTQTTGACFWLGEDLLELPEGGLSTGPCCPCQVTPYLENTGQGATVSHIFAGEAKIKTQLPKGLVGSPLR